MEKDFKSSNHKKIHLDLPKIQNKILSMKSSSKQNLHPININLQFNLKYQNIKKIYQVNNKSIQKSPYSIAHQKKNKKKNIHLIKTNPNYTITEEILQTIKSKFSYQNQQSTDQIQKIIKVKLQFQRKIREFNIKANTTEQLTKNLTYEFAKIIYSTKNNYKKCEQIIGYQTSDNNNELNFILSNPKLDITFLNEISLKPIFCPTITNCMQNTQVSFLDFQFIKCLGSGGFSTVFLAKGNFDNKYYAVKLIDKAFIIDSERDRIVQNQRFILGQLKSPFVTELEFAFQTKNHFVFVIQYCPGGQLFYQLKRVKRMKEEQAKFYFLEILIGLDYIHQKNIVYRDLKPQNLLIGVDGHIRIADFGLSKPVNQKKQKSYSFCGSPEYMAPEMLQKSGHNYLLDYYCLGALLYELVIGIPPYYSLNRDQIYDAILNQDLSFPTNIDLSEDLKNLLRELLQKNHKMRLGCIFGVKEILLHPWVGKLKQKSIQDKELQPPFIPNLQNFNFDLGDIKTDEKSIYKKIQEDRVTLKFEPHFNREFYYKNASFRKNIEETIKRLKENEETVKSQSYDMKQRISFIKSSKMSGSCYNLSHRIWQNYRSPSEEEFFSQQKSNSKAIKLKSPTSRLPKQAYFRFKQLNQNSKLDFNEPKRKLKKINLSQRLHLAVRK